ncbi:MAG: autotransporter-associated beta strand repeat-containing protein [Chloroflexi bacterium]|nr:autotransporter-associated beta strand repeat-containing protein [Chloroflexota bacterium]
MLNPIFRLIVFAVILSALVLIQGYGTPVAAQRCIDPASGREIPCPPQPLPGQGNNNRDNNNADNSKSLRPPIIAPVEINPNTNPNPVDSNTNLDPNLPNGQPQLGIDPSSFGPQPQPFQPLALVGILGVLAAVGIVVVAEWKYAAVRRIALFIEKSLHHGTKWSVFEPNDERFTKSGDGTLKLTGKSPDTLTKTGDGTLKLTGDNSYEGTTKVGDGTLKLTGEKTVDAEPLKLTGNKTVDGETLKLTGDSTSTDARQSAGNNTDTRSSDSDDRSRD